MKCPSSAGEETCFSLITCKALTQCSKDICTTAGSHCSPRLFLAVASSISHLCQRKVMFFKPQWQTKEEEEVWEVQQISVLLCIWCDSTQKEGDVQQPHPWEHFASSSRDRDPQHIHSLGSINPWPGASETWQQVSHPRTNWETPTSDMEGQREEMFTLNFPPSICLVRHAEGWVSAAHQ